MNIQKGDRVFVNLAPFIGAVLPSKESIPCIVLDVDDRETRVCTEPPYRQVSLWVLSSWVGDKVKERPELASLRP
jgi:hypothetical protein